MTQRQDFRSAVDFETAYVEKLQALMQEFDGSNAEETYLTGLTVVLDLLSFAGYHRVADSFMELSNKVDTSLHELV